LYCIKITVLKYQYNIEGCAEQRELLLHHNCSYNSENWILRRRFLAS